MLSKNKFFYWEFPRSFDIFDSCSLNMEKIEKQGSCSAFFSPSFKKPFHPFNAMFTIHEKSCCRSQSPLHGNSFWRCYLSFYFYILSSVNYNLYFLVVWILPNIWKWWKWTFHISFILKESNPFVLNLLCLPFNTGSQYCLRVVGVSVELWWEGLVCQG